MSSKTLPVAPKRKLNRPAKTAAPAHRAPEDGYRVLFERNLAGAFRTTLEGRFLDCNDAFVEMFGYTSREEVLRHSAPEFHSSPADREAVVARLVEEGALTNVEVSIRRKDGSNGVALCNLTLSGDDDGQRRIIEGSIVDITAQKRAQQEAAKRTAYLHALVDNNPLAIVVLDPDYRVRMCNPAFERIFKYRQKEMLGANLDELLAPGELHAEAVKLTQKALKGESVRVTTRRRRKDGSLVDVVVYGMPFEVDGKPFGGFGIYEDVTERKRAEEELERLSRQNDLILNSAGEGIFGIDLRGKQTFVNLAAAKLLGYNAVELHGRHAHSTWHHSKADGSPYPVENCPIYAVIRDGVTRHASDEVFWRKDGTSFPVEYISTPIYESGKLVGAVVTFKDITERKKAEDALRAAEERYRSIFENAVEGFFQTTPDGGYVSINPALARMYGYSSPQELADSVRDIGRQVYVNPARREEFKRLMEEQGVVEGFEYQVFRKDGVKIWLSENARAVRDASGKLIYYEGTVEDVTELKRAEAERQVTYEIIHAVNVTENLDDLLRLIHQSLEKVLYAQNCFIALNDRATGLFHFPFFVDKYDTVPPPTELGKSCTAYVFRTGKAMLIPQSVFEDLVKQGEVELVGTNSPSWLGVPLRTPSETIGVLVVQDYEGEGAYTERDLEFLASVGGQIAVAIERKRAEKALRESEARQRVLIEQLPAVLWTTDTELRFTSSLGAGLARLGLKPNQVVGMSLYEYFQTENPEFLPITAHRRAIAGQAVTFQIEWHGGAYACHAEPLRSADGQPLGAICMALDVTDRKQLEAQLRQAQKMEAVGRLAGGIAHDFNNLLMVIQGYTELLLERLMAGDPLRKNAEHIHDATDRAAALTRQLLAFSRKQLLAPKVLDLCLVVADMEKMLRRLIGEDVELATLTPPGLWSVKADRSQIEQVILNLAVNSRDAMPRGGKLTIETANVELDNAYARQHPLVTPGKYVMLAVTDTGCGMNAETQAHVFEPFFTTKEKGKGTGLGLATVYGVVKQSGGYVWVYSEPDKGTTFKVYLPRVEEPVSAKERQPALEAPQRGSETILLVEDEKGVRELAREFLESNGYSVLLAEDGNDAIELVHKHPGKIDLLLTDVVMPGMSGRDLAERIEGLRPGIKVLYMSGYTDQAIVHHGILDSDSVLLQKPFTLSGLARKLREALERPGDRNGLRRDGTPVLGSARSL